MLRAEYVCFGRYPIEERYTQALDEGQLRIYHAWLVEETLPCMQQLGYPIPTPPTLEVFIATYQASGQLFFLDSALAPGTEAEAMAEVVAHCDVEPPEALLHGSD